MSNYTDGFKARQVQRMAGPEGIGVTALSEETGVSRAALYRWMKTASNVDGMTRGKSNRSGPSRSKQWTPEEQLKMLARAIQLSQAELGTYLREQGLHEVTLQQWSEAATSGLSAMVKPRNTKKSPEAKEVLRLKRELLRKEKALAELAALITLQKKVQAIWGDEGADMGTRNAT